MEKTLVLALLLGLAGLGFGTWLGTGTPRAPRMNILSNTNSATVMDVRIPGVAIETAVENGVSYDIVSLPGQTMAALDVGKPQVPKLAYLLGTPDHAQVSVTVTVLESQTFENVNCYPYQTPTTDESQKEIRNPKSGIRNQFDLDREFYARNTVYPEIDARIANTGTWRGLPVTAVEVFPVKYNPGTEQLSVATRLRVSVNYSGGTYRPMTIEPWLARAYSTTVDNLGKLGFHVAWNDSPGVRYLVINCSQYQCSWLDSLLNWHQKRGVETKVVTLDGSWPSPDSVHSVIKREYDSHSPAVLRWVLLVGRQDEIPQYSFSGVGESDYYYTSMDDGTNDLYPEVGVARLYCDDTSDLANQVKKILKYEKNPDNSSDWLAKTTLAAHSEEYPGKYSACIRGIYAYPFGFYHYAFDTIQGGCGGTDAMVTSDINEGRGIVNYRGHGDAIEWSSWDANSMSYSVTDVLGLTNGDKTPVVFNCACENHTLTTPNCLGVTWMKKYPGGAVASLGATTASYTIPNHGWDSLLFSSVADTITVSIPGVRDYLCPSFDLGWTMNNADAYIVKNYSSQGGEDNAEMYLWLGDPALEVWSGGVPQAAQVGYPAAIPMGEYSLPVTVKTGGTPVQGALVCAWKDTEFYATGHTDDQGQATLAVNSDNPGAFSVTVSGGHAATSPHTPVLPFEGTCLAHSGYYVTYRRHTIDDPAPGGNGDGIINPTETVNMPVWVVNRGNLTGDNVVARLRTSDRSIIITDSVKSLGTIPVNDSGTTGANGFKFRVGDTCSNRHPIAFSLFTQDATDSSWTSGFQDVVGAGVLSCAGRRVNDPRPGGNGNGRLDPGESAQVFISLRDTGLGQGYHISARLHSGDARMQVTDSLGGYGTIWRDSAAENSSDPFVVHIDAGVAQETGIPCTLFVTGDDAYNAALPVTLVIGELRPDDPIHDNVQPVARYWAIDDADSGYTGRPTYNWIEARGLGQCLHMADDVSQPVSLPTAFGPLKFYDQRATMITVCSNGWLIPGITSNSSAANAELPTAVLPNAAVCANWGDLAPDAGHDVWALHDTARHAFVIEWDSVPCKDSVGSADRFEIVIFDTTLAASDGTNQILVQYQTANGFIRTTLGIQDQPRTHGINCLFNGVYNRGTSPIRPMSAIKYTTNVPVEAVAERPVSILPGRLAVRASDNPFRGSGRVSFSLPAKAQARLAVYDVNGRLVRVLLDSRKPVEPGVHVLHWDGRSADGATAASGVYFYRLETSLGFVAGKAVKLD